MGLGARDRLHRERLFTARNPVDAIVACENLRARAASGFRASSASIHGGLTTIRPHPPSALRLTLRCEIDFDPQHLRRCAERRKRRTRTSGSCRPLIGYQSRKMPVAHLRWAASSACASRENSSGVLERRIDQDDAAPLRRRHIGIERGPAVDRDRLERAGRGRGCGRARPPRSARFRRRSGGPGCAAARGRARASPDRWRAHRPD